MRILYLTNIHNPYRDEFFEQLGRRCDLTVLFEDQSDAARDESWFSKSGAHLYHEEFLPNGENKLISHSMLKMIERELSLVVVGCYNSPRQMAAIMHMKSRRIPYVVNFDGPLSSGGGWVKRAIREHLLQGADAFLVAGRRSVASVRREVGRNARVASYPFSSLTREQVKTCSDIAESRDINLILCVGQFETYKGLDILLDAAVELPALRFRVVGMGSRRSEFESLAAKKGLTNVESVAFLPPEELAHEYAHAGLFVLPSRQECWGLVVNEAAAYGIPIVSTWGSGAAVEFLSDGYPQFLAEPRSAESLVLAIHEAMRLPDEERNRYSDFLRNKTAAYTIESMVDVHVALFDELTRRGNR